MDNVKNCTEMGRHPRVRESKLSGIWWVVSGKVINGTLFLNNKTFHEYILTEVYEGMLIFLEKLIKISWYLVFFGEDETKPRLKFPEHKSEHPFELKT